MYPRIPLPTTSNRHVRVIQVIWFFLTGLLAMTTIAGVSSYEHHVTMLCITESCLASQPRDNDRQNMTDAGVALTPADARLQTIITLFTATFALLVGLFAMWRRPGDLGVQALSTFLVALAASEFVTALALERPDWQMVAVSTRLIELLVLTALVTLLPSGRWTARWQASATGVLMLLAVLATLDPSQAIVAVVIVVGITVCASINLAIAFFRAQSAATRDQVVWGSVGLVLLGLAQLVGRPIRTVPLSSLPIDLSSPSAPAFVSTSGMVLLLGGITCLAIALLRTELIDVEIVLNRTLVYGLLSVTIVAGYVLIVGMISLIFHTQESLWLSVVATGIIALLVQPVRDAVQHLVNHLLYGRRDEPSAVITRLGQRLEAALPTDAVLPAIVETVAADLKLPYVVIELIGPGQNRMMRASTGHPTENAIPFPLQYQGEEVGALIVAPRLGESDLGDADRRLLVDLARQAGIAAHAVRLTDALQHSRERLVIAREEERRRLRRDLHDGLGPALATITLQSGTAYDLVEHDPAAAQEVLEGLTIQAQATMGEVRRLIHAIRPPVLDDLGLVAALRGLARSLEVPGLEITVDAPSCLPRLSAALDAAVYRIVQGALMNVTKHAHARSCRVTLHVSDGVELEIRDDGQGLPDVRESGVGLLSMRERAEELGGTFHIRPAPDGGTIIEVRFPRPEGDASGCHPRADC